MFSKLFLIIMEQENWLGLRIIETTWWPGFDIRVKYENIFYFQLTIFAEKMRELLKLMEVVLAIYDSNHIIVKTVFQGNEDMFFIYW